MWISFSDMYLEKLDGKFLMTDNQLLQRQQCNRPSTQVTFYRNELHINQTFADKMVQCCKWAVDDFEKKLFVFRSGLCSVFKHNDNGVEERIRSQVLNSNIEKFIYHLQNLYIFQIISRTQAFTCVHSALCV